MDIDVSVTWDNYSSDLPRKLAAVGAREIEGFVQVNRSFDEVGGQVEFRVIEFIEEIERVVPQPFKEGPRLEIAYYYDAESRAHFGAELSAAFVAFLGERNLGLKLIGYPCIEEGVDT